MDVDCIVQVNQFLFDTKKIEKIAKKIIKLENQQINSQINIVFVDNKLICKLNKQFLGHDFATDVISFPLEKMENYIEGEIYISFEQAELNANDFSTTIEEETWRLVIHGILHLLGYNDQTVAEKRKMKAKEDYYLKKFELTERNSV